MTPTNLDHGPTNANHDDDCSWIAAYNLAKLIRAARPNVKRRLV